MLGEVADILLMTEKLLPGGTSEERKASFALLIERAKTGDAAAFEQVMISSQHKVASLAWRRLGNEEDARDATQEVFLRVYKYLHRFKEDQDFLGWLYRITINVCHDMERKHRRGKDHLASLDAEHEGGSLERLVESDNAEKATLLRQRRAMIASAMKTLPEKERTAIILRDLEGLPTEEVARLMGSRPATVRVQISSARTKIKHYCDHLLKRRGPK